MARYIREKGGKMKKTLLIVLIMLAGCSPLKGVISPKFTALEAQGDVNAVKAEVQSMKNDVALIKGNMDTNAQAVAGIGNEIQKMAAGRDMTNTTTSTNDTKLMTYVVKVLAGLCTTLIGILGWCLKTLIKRGKEKDFYKKSYFLKMDPKENLEDIKNLHDQFVKGGKKK
jgi:hypothetical protein